MRFRKNRRAFTIVELVIVIAVIAILAAVLIPTFASVIENAENSNAKQEAANAYKEYMAENIQYEDIPSEFIYEAESGKVVALKDGTAVGVYANETEALTAMGIVSPNTNNLYDCGDGKLAVYDAVALAKPTTSGVTFTSSNPYTISKTIDCEVPTCEAWIKLDSDKYGVILGSNYSSTDTTLSTWDFLVNYEGKPMMNYHNISYDPINYTINHTTDVRTGDWIHVAIVNDNPNGKHSFYVNGKLVSTLDRNNKPLPISQRISKIGGSNIENNTQYFKGEIYSIALYNDVRSEREIKRDATSPSPNGLVAAWNFADAGSTVRDISGNGYDATR